MEIKEKASSSFTLAGRDIRFFYRWRRLRGSRLRRNSHGSIDGVYDDDPKKNPTQKIRPAHREILEKEATMVMDLPAARLCLENKNADKTICIAGRK